MVKIKIISDGNVFNTHVINEETGEDIPVTRFVVTADSKERFIRVSLDIPKVSLDINADVDIPQK